MKMRTRSKCGEINPETVEFFHRNNTKPCGFKANCKKCIKEYDAKKYSANKEKIYERANGSSESMTQDHFIALTKGGEYTINNIIPACSRCNFSKHNKDFFEWYPRQKYYSKQREENILKYLNYHNGLQQLALI